MTIAKDVEGYFKANYSEFLKAFSECAVDDLGRTNVTSVGKAYRFDDIAKTIFIDKPASVDCIFFRKEFIELIEFKGGVIDRFNSNYQQPNYNCDNCNYLHKEYFKQLAESHRYYKKALHQNLQLKIVETLLVLINHIIPKCTDSDREYKIKLILVINLDATSPLDALEIQYNDKAKLKSSIDEISRYICKYVRSNNFNEKIFLDEYKVLTDLEFNQISDYN